MYFPLDYDSVLKLINFLWLSRQDLGAKTPHRQIVLDVLRDWEVRAYCLDSGL